MTHPNTLTAQDVAYRLKEESTNPIVNENRAILEGIERAACHFGLSITTLLKAAAESTNLMVALSLYIASLDKNAQRDAVFPTLVYTGIGIGAADSIAKQHWPAYQRRSEIILNALIEYMMTAAVLNLNLRQILNFTTSQSQALSACLATYLTTKELNEYLQFTSRQENFLGQILSSAYRAFLVLTLFTVIEDINPNVSIQPNNQQTVFFAYWATDFLTHSALTLWMKNTAMNKLQKAHNTILQFAEMALLSYQVLMQTAAIENEDDPTLATFILVGILSLIIAAYLAYLQHQKETFIDANDRLKDDIDEIFSKHDLERKPKQASTELNFCKRLTSYFYGAEKTNQDESWRSYFWRSACETATSFKEETTTAAQALYVTLRG